MDRIMKIDEHLRTRIRVIIWKQWKKIRKRQKALEQFFLKMIKGENQYFRFSLLLDNEKKQDKKSCFLPI